MKTKPEKIVLASSNEHKAREFSQMLEPLGIHIVLQSEFNVSEVEENGKSFVENALIKARHASFESGLPALADDSGICVDYLDGTPGILSARYCGEHGKDKENNELLLKNLENVPEGQRSARFYCALAFVKHADDPTPLIATASWQGEIGKAPQGLNGFGYDPIFYIRSRKCSAAQLLPQVKNLLSHRGKAIHRLVRLLELEYGK